MLTASILAPGQLQELINSLDYPISAKRLVETAIRKKYAPSLINFYLAFPDDQLFANKNDLEDRTAVLEIMRYEPQPIEDIVHGAED